MAVALVQAQSNQATATANLAVGATQGWATPSTGNLLVAWSNSDTTVTGPTGFTAGPSVVDGNGVYIWYKVSAGTESTITFTHTANYATVGVLEYSGLTGTPFDVQNSSTIAGGTNTSTTAVSVTTTNVAGDLIVALAGLHALGVAYTTETWTNSFVNRQLVQTTPQSTTGCATFVADLYPSVNGTYSTACSFSPSAGDVQELVIAFKATAGGGGAAPVKTQTIVQRAALNRAFTY